MAAVFIFLAFLIVIPATARPQTEDELEQMARKIAIEAASFNPLRWPPGLFPLRVAFDSGENLKRKTDCSAQWQRNYEQYVEFINFKKKLLTPTAIASTVDAFAFFGSESELDNLAAYRLQEAWGSKPDISTQFRILDRQSHSYRAAFGRGDFVDFSSAYVEITPQNLVQCDPSRASRNVGLALLQSYASDIRNQAYRFSGGNIPPTVEWRAHRRALSAMTRLPEYQQSLPKRTLSLIEALSNE